MNVEVFGGEVSGRGPSRNQNCNQICGLPEKERSQRVFGTHTHTHTHTQQKEDLKRDFGQIKLEFGCRSGSISISVSVVVRCRDRSLVGRKCMK